MNTRFSVWWSRLRKPAAIFMIFFFLIRSLFIASQIQPHRPAAAFMVVGLTSSLAFHYIENLGMCVGLMPITGIPFLWSP